MAAGFLCNWSPPTGAQFISTVIKFNGVTGAELWRQVVAVGAIATLDARAMWSPQASTKKRHLSDFTAIKFNGATGADSGARSLTAPAMPLVRTRPGGCQRRSGQRGGRRRYHEQRHQPDFTVIKFNGATGTEIWRQVINDADANANGFNTPEARALAIDPAGNVVAAGLHEQRQQPGLHCDQV